MATLAISALGGAAGSACGILRGGGRPGDALREMGQALCDGLGLEQRRWIIDNRAVEGPLALVDLARFAHLARTHPAEISGLRVAWLSSRRLSNRLRSMIAELPLAFAEFDDFEAARCWLEASD